MKAVFRHWRWVLACLGSCLGLGLGLIAAALPSSASSAVTSYAGQLNAVGASSPANVWAVGSSATARNTGAGTLVLRRNRSTWIRVPSPSPGARYNTALTGVSVFSPSNVWAVGYYYNPSTGYEWGLILHWNGRTITEVPGPHGLRQQALLGISGLAPGDIWAVGTAPSGGGPYGHELLHWNGKAWSVVYTHGRFGCGGGPDALWFASPSDGWAVGAYCVQQDSGTRPVILRWNGAAWASVPSPDPGGISAYDQPVAVSGSSASDVWAVGSNTLSGTLVLHWNGTAWRPVPAPHPGAPGASALSGVSALTPADAWSVGGYAPGFAERTLTLHWNGSTWVRVPSPNHAGPHGTILNGVDAVSANDVWAVGFYGANAGTVPQTWILHWNGSSWASS